MRNVGASHLANMTNEGMVTSIKDVKPGQKNLTVIFIVLEIGKICKECG